LFYTKELTLGEFTSYSTIIFQIFSMFQALSFQFGGMLTNARHINEFKEFIKMEEDHTFAPSSCSASFPLQEGISLQNVSFMYPNQDREVLSNISFTIKPGEKIAIVGDNGAGKSTLIKCLIGLYRVSNGKISYNNINVNDISRHELQKHVSVIFQDFVKYDMSVKENIGVGNIEEIDNEVRMMHIMQKTDLGDTVNRLSDGLNTKLGYTFKEGRTLSGGEWQKIAISRALFKHAEIFILDEPTAALDPIAESGLLEKFMSIIENNTGIVISHRLGFCRFADRVIVLREGKLVEEGSHVDLISKNGIYAKMYEAQSKWYTDVAVTQQY
jgi:ATP-binding cassette subfamily B protein